MNNTAKHFVLQLGSLASLYLTLSFLIAMLFGVITICYPDAANSWEGESAHSQIRLGFAMVIVFFPAYLLLTRAVNKLRRKEKGAYMPLTKWLIYLSLLVGGGVLLGDLVAVIMTYLEGELTERFILKALVVLTVVGSAFYYYLLDARGHWLKNETQSLYYGAGMIVVVLVSLGFAVTKIDTPTEVRAQRLDATQIENLTQIQWRLMDYYTINNKLPGSLDDVGEPPLPTAPDGRAAYEYRVTEDGFELCANFASDSKPDQYYGMAYPVMEKGSIRNPDNWQHGDGRVCFDRIVNPPTDTDPGPLPR